MPGKLRVQLEGAIDHMMSRGNARRDIVADDRDRRHFVDRLGSQVRRSRPGSGSASSCSRTTRGSEVSWPTSRARSAAMITSRPRDSPGPAITPWPAASPRGSAGGRRRSGPAS